MTMESLRKENVVIALLVNYGKEVYEQIKSEISPEDFKLEQNKKIIRKMYEEFEKGKSNIENIEDLFTEEDCISQIKGIMAEDFGIEDKQKGVNDVLNLYRREKLTTRKKEIIKKLDNPELSQEEAKQLEKELSNIIVSLAKRKMEG